MHADIDECANAALNDTELCTSNSQCVNTEGSYECVCIQGYVLNNETNACDGM